MKREEVVRAVLLDIEGTTSSVRFVYDVMFPFAARHLPAHVEQNWGTAELVRSLQLLATDLGHDCLESWLDVNSPASQQVAIDAVNQLMADDVKATGLKSLQGQIWQHGFESGELVAHVYDDVPPALQSWSTHGLPVRIYSSGSIAAQKLFFAHSQHGNLLPHFSGHYDTTTGPKKEAESYRKIAQDFGLASTEILFVSDIPAELEAASETGMPVRLSRRPGNAEVGSEHGFEEITGFDQLPLAASG